MHPILIQNATLLPGGDASPSRGDLLIHDGVIAAMGERVDAPPDAEVIDATGLSAAPGLIDLHVHLRDPGQTAKEDIFSGCRAAAAGGITSLLAMPNTSPPVDTPGIVRSIARRAQDAAARVYVAAAITRGQRGEALTDFAALRAAGIRAVTDDGRPVPDAATQRAAMRSAREQGLLAVSHAEDLSLAKGGIMHEGDISRALGVPGIPRAAEDVATAREVTLCVDEGLPIHIAHVSTWGAVEMIRQAKRAGAPVTCETAPHYFSLTHESLRARDARFRMNPPLREERDRQAVIEGLIDGTIDAIATDHAPHTQEDKSDFASAPNGVVGLETSLAAGITYLVRPGHLSLEALINRMSTRPAEILGVVGGRVAVGRPADLCLFDPDEVWEVDPGRFHSKARNTPFAGRTLTGRAKLTICGGRVTYRFGQIPVKI